ncbi:MAG: hypothetical protein U0074_00965 [Kouleothrix sp.]
MRFLDLEPVLLTTQIEPHDTIAELCDALKRTNTILIDLCQDVWRYISAGYLVQAPKANEVSLIDAAQDQPDRDFENAEGNLGLANALLEFFSRKLPISRLQRDLRIAQCCGIWAWRLGIAACLPTTAQARA